MQLYFPPLLSSVWCLTLTFYSAPKSHFMFFFSFPSSSRSRADLDALMKHVSLTWSDVLQRTCMQEHARACRNSGRQLACLAGLEEHMFLYLSLWHIPIPLNMIAFWKLLLDSCLFVHPPFWPSVSLSGSTLRLDKSSNRFVILYLANITQIW